MWKMRFSSSRARRPGGTARVSAGAATIARPPNDVAGAQVRLLIDRGRHPIVAPPHGALALGPVGLGPGQLLARELRLLDLDGAGDDRVGDQIAELRRLRRARVDLAVLVLERLDQRVDVADATELLGGRVDLDVVELPVVLHADEEAVADLAGEYSGLLELGRHPGLERVPRLLDAGSGRRLGVFAGAGQDRQVDRQVVAVLQVGARAAERREARRPRRHEHVAVGDLVRVAGDVQGTAAAVAEQRVVDRRVALAEHLP
jgi:hypothetical protein